MANEIREEYEVAFEPDKLQLRDLIKKAKGSNRTMAQYAEECGVSASTLSRIANAKINSAVSEELIRSLYEHQDPECDISLDSWMRANGMRRKSDRTRDDFRYQQMQRMRERRDREVRMERAITNSLTDRGIMLQKMSRQMVRCDQNTRFGLERRSDLTLHMPDGEYFWNFFIYAVRIDEDNPRYKNREIELRQLVRHIVETSSSVFLLDAWDPEIMANEKISFVFPDEDVMNAFIQCLEGAKVHNKFSVVLMDREGEHVLKEVNLRGEEDTDSLFLRDVVAEEDDWHRGRFGKLTFFDLEDGNDDGEGDE